MNKINNKGFMLAELMIASVMLIGTIVGLYTGFNRLYSNYKLRNNYDKVEDIYGIKSIKDFLIDQYKINSLIKNNADIVDITNCNNAIFTCDTSEENYYNNIKETYEISQILFTKYDIDAANVTSNNEHFQAYLDYLKKDVNITSSIYSNGYRIIVESLKQDSNIHRFANIPVGNIILEGGTNLDTSGANVPKIISGMIPVLYDGSKWVKADGDNGQVAYQWYDYNQKKWANAVMINNNSSIPDLSGNGYGLQVFGATLTNEGLSFDGINDYAYIPSINYNNSKAITIDFVAKIDSASSALILESSVNANTNSGGFFINTKEFGTNEIAFNLKYNNNAIRTCKYVNNITDASELKHYTITFNSENEYDNFTKIYLNAASQEIVNQYASSDIANRTITNFPLYIGSRAGSTGFTKMVLSELRIYNRELSQSEIQRNKNGNIVTDGLILSYDFSNIKTTKAREGYMSAPIGTPINENDISAYFVWIPRYKYKLFNAGFTTGTTSNQIDITFETGKAKTGIGTTNGTYKTHPAFTFGSDELTGMWVGKFETTGTENAPTIKHSQSSIYNISVARMYNTTKFFQSSTYLSGAGLNKTDAHLMKNTEWGAVAYLTNSQYGKNSEVAQNTSTITGGGSSNAYITNVEQSTTGNITGIYDMSGGRWENVMGNYANYSGSSGFGTIQSSKYINIYSGTTTGYSQLGDALGETIGWNGDSNAFVNSSYPWFLRGHANTATTGAGVFSYTYTTGEASYAFRTVVVKK